MEIIPGILEKEWSEIERKINLIRSFAKTIHIDIIDGKFAPNITFLDPLPFKKFTSDLFFELHMMVENPIQYLKPFADVGFKRFLGHIEKMPDQEEFVVKAQSFGEVGLAIDGPTPLSMITIPYEDLDCVLVMTIKAGESGQMFNPEYLKKVEMLKPFGLAQGGQVQDDTKADMKIEVDGGINNKTIVEAYNSGATRFVANSFIFNSQNPQEQYNLLKKCLE